MGIKGKHKLADIWDASPYIVKRQPMKDIPVYEVYQENGNTAKCRMLHRNMLLPFMALAGPGNNDDTTEDVAEDDPVGHFSDIR